MRVVFGLVHSARDLAKEGSLAWLEMSAALAVCDLVLQDRKECSNEPGSPSMWALESVPTAIKEAKAVVDGEPWRLFMAVAA